MNIAGLMCQELKLSPETITGLRLGLVQSLSLTTSAQRQH